MNGSDHETKQMRVNGLQFQVLKVAVELLRNVVGEIDLLIRDGGGVREIPNPTTSGASVPPSPPSVPDGLPPESPGAAPGNVPSGDPNTTRLVSRRSRVVSSRMVANIPGSMRTLVREAVAKAHEPFTCDAIAVASGVERKKVSVVLASLVTRFELKRGARMDKRQTYERTSQFLYPGSASVSGGAGEV